MSSGLEQWVKTTFEGGIRTKITPRLITVSLLGPPSDSGIDVFPVMAVWQVTNAYPVKWEISPFNAEKNELVIETLEFCYNELERLV